MVSRYTKILLSQIFLEVAAAGVVKKLLWHWVWIWVLPLEFERLGISCFQVTIWLKIVKASKQPNPNQIFVFELIFVETVPMYQKMDCILFLSHLSSVVKFSFALTFAPPEIKTSDDKEVKIVFCHPVP